MTALDQHMMELHLALGQLWRCPVEWCTVWKGSASDCLAHVGEKHGGSENVVVDKLEKLFPPWTVTRDFWQAALRPDVWRWTSGCSMTPDAGWCTNTGCSGVLSLIWH